jgi:Ca-activated chloride channel family protein
MDTATRTATDGDRLPAPALEGTGADTSQLMETPITGKEPDQRRRRIRRRHRRLRPASAAGRSIWATGAGIRPSRWRIENRGDDPYGYRVEAVNLMRLAESLSEPN